MKKVLVTGSTGKVGSIVVEDLVTAGEAVVASSRRPETLKERQGIEVRHFDYADPATYAEALREVDRVFLMEPQPPLGPADSTMLPLVAAAAERRCKIVLLSSASVTVQEEPLSHVEAAVKGGERNIILRSNWFMDNFHTWWVESIKHYRVLALPAADARSPFIEARDVGAAAAVALRQDDLDGQTFSLTGGESLSYFHAVWILSQACGRRVDYEPIDEVDFTETLLLAKLPPEYVEYLIGLFRITRSGLLQEPTGDFERLLERKARTLEEYAFDYRDAWR